MEILPTLVEHYGEPFADSSAIPSYYVSRETRRYVTVALNGDGGDECFAGYERYAAMNIAQTYANLPGSLREGVIANLVNALPAGTSKTNPISKAQRFVAAASLKPVDRYLRWITAFDETAKSNLYSDEMRHASADWRTAGFIEPWNSRRFSAGRYDDLFAERFAREDGHRQHVSFARGAFAVPRSSPDGVCRDLTGESQAARLKNKVSIEARVKAAGAARESHAAQDGFRRADRILVPWLDAAAAARNFAVRSCFKARALQTGRGSRFG